jgi:hypothetical protein
MDGIQEASRAILDKYRFCFAKTPAYNSKNARGEE